MLDKEQTLSDIVLNNAQCGLLIIDSDYLVVDSNSWFLNAAGLSPDGCLGEKIFTLFAFEQPKTLKRVIDQACQYGMASVLSSSLHPRLFPLKNRHHQPIEQLCFVTSIKYSGRRFCLIQVQDVTDPTAREKKLRHITTQLDKCSLALKYSPSSVAIFNSDGLIEFINPKFSEMTGLSESKILNMNYFSLTCISSYQLETEVWALLRDGQEWVGECLKRNINGQEYWTQDHIYPIQSHDGTISHYVAVQNDITQLRNITHEISFKSTHDSLTGLINRQEFERVVTATVAQAELATSNYLVCFLNIDKFKLINDTCGHAGGDELLYQFATICQSHFDKSHVIARLGGDEFATLITSDDSESAIRRMEALIDTIASFRFRWGESVFSLGVSIGLTIIDETIKNTDDVIKQAESACDIAKDFGGNRLHIYQADDKDLIQRQGDTYWAAKVNQALEADSFVLFAQPIIPLQQQDKISFEVLVRLKDQSGQVIAPGLFLPAAERFNLSHKIDKWVIDHTLDWLANHEHELSEIDHLAINLSGLSLNNHVLLAHIIQAIEARKIEPSKISFEITETAAIANLEQAQQFIDVLRCYGCKFSLDDFGSGLSSFAYLKNLKVDILKIDGMFVKDILNDVIDEAMVRSINDIGHVCGMKTIAEFVENAQVKQRLTEIGVDFGQGYGLGKPMPIDDILLSKLDVA
ncbi:EAL domain-containing protein [Psychrobium sp. 1_MG-2023]|uniref:EAL domain-containing protein n=1 Tax=Psychrobium sp. 1_MG-2023 TaxID=3062624 RepID=UPI0026AA1482|nr:EAL domain-containing protein [Psychrobium sp. 1_MG-2023]MDP2560159.1 EAL domain-containing protein [Psychrobium sp. 1_MG-2023]